MSVQFSSFQLCCTDRTKRTNCQFSSVRSVKCTQQLQFSPVQFCCFVHAFSQQFQTMPSVTLNHVIDQDLKG